MSYGNISYELLQYLFNVGDELTTLDMDDKVGDHIHLPWVSHTTYRILPAHCVGLGFHGIYIVNAME